MNRRVVLLKNIEVTDLAGEKVIVDFFSGKYFLLKGTANDIWEYIQKPISINDIYNRLLAEYEVDPAVCYDSIIAFLTKLEDYDFIKLEDNSNA